jgi:hypothetical protein
MALSLYKSKAIHTLLRENPTLAWVCTVFNGWNGMYPIIPSTQACGHHFVEDMPGWCSLVNNGTVIISNGCFGFTPLVPRQLIRVATPDNEGRVHCISAEYIHTARVISRYNNSSWHVWMDDQHVRLIFNRGHAIYSAGEYYDQLPVRIAVPSQLVARGIVLDNQPVPTRPSLHKPHPSVLVGRPRNAFDLGHLMYRLEEYVTNYLIYKSY